MHINIYIEPFKVKVRFCLSVPPITAQNILAQPLNSTACIVHWEPVDDNRENLRGKLGGYRVSQSVNSDTIYAQGVVCAQWPRAVAHLKIYEIIFLPTMIQS